MKGPSFRMVGGRMVGGRMIGGRAIGWRGRVALGRVFVAVAILALGALTLAATWSLSLFGPHGAAADRLPPPPTDLGLNLYALPVGNGERVFANLIAQSEWLTTTGAGWGAMPPAQIDAHGWVRMLHPGQAAPRPLALPRGPFPGAAIRCTYSGQGRLSAGGLAALVARGPGSIGIRLATTGAPGESAWIRLDATSPVDPLRDLDCREAGMARHQVFDPAFLRSLRGFSALRFLDWQKFNDNTATRWALRTLPGDGSQVGTVGVALEYMVRLANEAHTDAWFIMPYNADDGYVRHFADYVHEHLDPARKVYVELGNEVWNDMFASARQARAEGLALSLRSADDPYGAQMRRYAQKWRGTAQIWTRVFADDPGRLVRVASSHNAYPDTAEMILGFEDVSRWTDALATAPYIHLDLAGLGSADVDRVFAGMDAAIDDTLDFARENRTVARRYGKRFIAYEGGQHLVTRDLALAGLIQRDPRMERAYARYLEQWRVRLGDRIMLYASTAPIGEYGSWGLREYAGQPLTQTPKLRAVRAFMAAGR